MKRSFRILLSIYLGFGFLTIPVWLFGQDEEETECVRTLNKAQKTYEDGLIEKVEQMIRPCLDNESFTKEEKLQAYRLLVLAKIYDDKEDEAEQAMLHFLKIDPEYQLQPGLDPKEFSELFDHYHTSPLYTIGVQFGLNWTFVNSYLERGIYNTENEKKEFSPKMSFQAGVKLSRYIYGGFNAHLGLMFVQNRFSYQQNILQDEITITTTESQTSVGVPLTFSYTFMRNRNIRPFIGAGGELRYLLSASQQDPVKEYVDLATQVTGPSIDVKNERNALNFNVLAEVGVKYKITRGDLFINFRYHMGMNNQRNENSDLDLNDDERLWNFYITDNNFTVDNLVVFAGYNLYLYKPRKKKERAEKLKMDE